MGAYFTFWLNKPEILPVGKRFVSAALVPQNLAQETPGGFRFRSGEDFPGRGAFEDFPVVEIGDLIGGDACEGHLVSHQNQVAAFAASGRR